MLKSALAAAWLGAQRVLVRFGRAVTLPRVAAGAARVAYLDGVRTVAILSVIGVHWVNPYFPIAPGGYIGVDIFFVLSGYIITRILWRQAHTGGGISIGLRYRHFLRQRVRRLYPALTAFVSVGLCAVAVAAPEMLRKGLVDGAIAEAQGMAVFLGLGGDGAVPFGHTWSLANEWYFYALWPVVIYWAAARNHTPARVAAFTFVVACLLYLMSLPTSGAWFYFGPTSRAAQILIGGAAALLVIAYPLARIRARTASALVSAGLLAVALWTVCGTNEFEIGYRIAGYPLAIVAAIALIVPGALATPGVGIRLLSWSPITYVGRVSYSLYLWHLLPIQLIDKDQFPGVPLTALAAAGVLIAIITTLGSYYAFERPFIRSKPLALGSQSSDGSDSWAPPDQSKPRRLG